jgi:DDE superfamily endonuclease
VLFYRAALPLSSRTLTFVSGLIRRHRTSIGSCWRKLNPGRQALLVLAYLRKGETFAELAAPAPRPRQAVRAAKKAGYAYVVLDGTLIPVDRLAADRPFHSGKHKKHGMNLQVIASPAGDILWVSGAPPGSVHDKKAEWIWGVLAELEAVGLVTLADKGYQGSAHAKIPYRGKNKPESQKAANRAHAKLRAPGERANAQLKTWRILRKLRCCPWRAGQLAKAIHVCRFARHKQDGKGSLQVNRYIPVVACPLYLSARRRAVR